MSFVNLNNTTPPAPSGSTNVLFQTDGAGNVSAYVNNPPTPPVPAVGVRGTFSTGGTLSYAHNLNTLNPLMNAYVNSGATNYHIAIVDANHVSVTTTAASDITCVFQYVPTTTVVSVSL